MNEGISNMLCVLLQVLRWTSTIWGRRTLQESSQGRDLWMSKACRQHRRQMGDCLQPSPSGCPTLHSRQTGQ